MGNMAFISKNAAEEDSDEIVAKVRVALEKKHLRLHNMNLHRLPIALNNPTLRTQLNEPLRTLDLHLNPQLEYLPFIHFPNLTDLNLWGNNMRDESFAPYPHPHPPHEHVESSIRKSARRIKRKRANTDKITVRKRTKSDGDLATEFGAFSGLPKLDSLDLGFNQLVKIPESLKFCLLLSRLTLTANRLNDDEIALKPLLALNQLTSLELDLNELHVIPISSLQTCKTRLLSLVLRGNHITEVPNTLQELTALQKLHLGDNKINLVEPLAFESLVRLKTLDLGNNVLQTLPTSCLSSLESLVDLIVSENQLRQLPTLLGLVNLRNIHAEYNQIESLPDLTGLTSLTELYIQHNQLTHLPDSIGLVPHLRILDASSNQLDSLPTSFSQLSYLDTLILNGNQFESGGDDDVNVHVGLQPIWQLSTLRKLHLGLNQIRHLPAHAFHNCSRLQILNLAHNQLNEAHFPSFPILPVPERARNELDEEDEDIPVILSGYALVQLFLGGNRFHQVPLEALRGVKDSLEVLSMENNASLMTIPAEISMFTRLQRLSVTLPASLGVKRDAFLPRSLPHSLKRLYVGNVSEKEHDEHPFTLPADCVLPKLECTDIRSLSAYPPNGLPANVGHTFDSVPCGWALATGDGHALEDCVALRSFELPNLPGTQAHLYCVLDGHGGDKVSLYVQKHLPVTIENLLRTTNYPDEFQFDLQLPHVQKVHEVLRQGFLDTNTHLEAYLQSEGMVNEFIGSTCVLVLCVSNTIVYCVNAGDSRAVLGSMVPTPSATAEGDGEFCGGIVPISVHDRDKFRLSVHRSPSESKPSPRTSSSPQEMHFHTQRKLEASESHPVVPTSPFLKLSTSPHPSLLTTASSNDILPPSSFRSDFESTKYDSTFDNTDTDEKDEKPVSDNDSGASNIEKPSTTTAATTTTPIEKSESNTSKNEVKQQDTKESDSYSTYSTSSVHHVEHDDGEGHNTSVDNCKSEEENYLQLKAIRLSEDHKPGSVSEIERIRQSGGYVSATGGSSNYRLVVANGPSLAVSRSFGDFNLRPALVVDPYFSCYPIQFFDQFIVLASDGLWDVLSDEQCVEICTLMLHQCTQQHLSIQKSCYITANYLRDLSFALGSQDDLSVIVVPLNWNILHSIDNYYQNAPVPGSEHTLPDRERKNSDFSSYNYNHNEKDRSKSELLLPVPNPSHNQPPAKHERKISVGFLSPRSRRREKKAKKDKL